MKKNKSKKKNQTKLQDYPVHLRGLSNNRWGGHQTSRLRGFGNNYGAASNCHTFTEEQKMHWMKARGLA